MQKTELKKQVDSLVNELPEDTTWGELMYKIYVRQSIEEGLQDSQKAILHLTTKLKRSISLPNESNLDSQSRTSARSYF